MNTDLKKNSALRYEGFLNPKNVLPRESILYHIGSAFLSLLFFVILYFLGMDPVMASSCSVMFSVGLFLLLFKLNNYFFKKDKRLLEHLVVFSRIDSVDLLSEFFQELQQAFELSSIPYFGSSEPSIFQATDISQLFRKIFREDGEVLYSQFKLQNGSFFKFVQLLTPLQREILYRHYLKGVSLK